MISGPSRRQEVWPIAAPAACAFAIGGAAAFTMTHVRSGAAFLFGEDGNNLLIADTLLRGGGLYRDVFTPYGPLPAFFSTAVAALFGVSPTVYLMSLAAISALNVALVASLARRVLSPWLTVLFTTALLPLLVIPGSLVGGFTFSPYVALERTVLLTAMLIWRPPPERSTRRAWALGLTIGAWQLVRFGGAAPAAAALVCVDLLYLVTNGGTREDAWRWIAQIAQTAAAILAVEAAIVGCAFAWLPRSVATDVVWPSFMFENYAWVTPELRWPRWIGWAGFVVQYVPVIVWFVAAALWRSPIRTWVVFLIPFWFYVLAAPVYFRHVNHFRQFAWALAIPAVVSFGRMPKTWRAIAIAFSVPAFAVFLRASIVPRVMDPTETVTLRDGATLTLTRADAERLARIMNALGPVRPDDVVMFLPYGAGWHALSGIRPATRHGIVQAGFVRPYEVAGVVAAAANAAAVIICPSASGIPGSSSPLDLRAEERFKEGLSRVLRRPIAIDSGCAVYR